MFNKQAFSCTENVLPAAPSTVSAQRVYWYYTNDTRVAVEADGYFDGVQDNGLNIGDVIHAVVDRGGASPQLKTYLVTAGGADVAIKGLGTTFTALTDNSGGAVSATIAAIADVPTRNAVASMNAVLNQIRTAIGV